MTKQTNFAEFEKFVKLGKYARAIVNILEQFPTWEEQEQAFKTATGFLDRMGYTGETHKQVRWEVLSKLANSYAPTPLTDDDTAAVRDFLEKATPDTKGRSVRERLVAVGAKIGVVLSLVMAVVLVGCGQRGGNIALDNPYDEKYNQRPVAVAPADMTVTVDSVVALDGTGSSDPEGEALTYAWTQVEGPAVTISNPAVASPTCALDTEGTYAFRLSVTDGYLECAQQDEVTVLVVSEGTPVTQEPGPNTWPVVNDVTASVYSVTASTRVTLVCDAEDADGDVLTYTWESDAGTLAAGTFVEYLDSAHTQAVWEAPPAICIDSDYEVSISVDVSDGKATAGCEIYIMLRR